MTHDPSTGQPPVSYRTSYLGAIAPYAESSLMVGAALAVGLSLRTFHIGAENIGLVFLSAILFSAIRQGLLPALFAVASSTLVYNFFFFAPFYTLRITDPANAVTVFFFGLVAVIGSNLAARVRAQNFAIRDHASRMENLYLFSRKLAGVYSLDDLLWATSFQIAQMLRLHCVIVLPEGESLRIRSGYPPDDNFSEDDQAAAALSWREGVNAGHGTNRFETAQRFYVPMLTARGTVGLIGVQLESGKSVGTEQKKLLDALADQAALAIERMMLADEMDRTRLAAEAEKLRSAILTSISHDLRTPLAAILGGITSLRGQGAILSAGAREELLATVQEEAERLNRFIANLLDMTRLESGALRPRLAPADLGDIVGSALHRASSVLGAHQILVNIETDLPPAPVDPALFEQVLFNLIDNAAKYSPPESRIAIHCLREGQHVLVVVSDEGNGIPPEDYDRIFEKFYRSEAADYRRAGTGLGLAICRGFVEAMGGTITAANRTDRPGAKFTITLPIADADRVRDAA